MNHLTLNRREALTAGLGFIAAAIAGCAGSPPPTLPGAVTDVIDTHTHFYNPDRPQGVPWPTKDDSFLYRKVLPKEYEAIARPIGITGTVVVEASPWADDNQFILDLAKEDPFIVGLCGSLPITQPDFKPLLTQFRKNPLFRGVRLRDENWTARKNESSFHDDLARLADADLQIDINTNADDLADIARLADRLPNLRIVVDHCANTKVDSKPVSPGWFGGMTSLAKRPNVWIKVSGLVEGTGKRDGTAPADSAYYHHVLDWLWRLFGEDHLIWGSNWPVSARFGSLSVTRSIVREFVSSKGGIVAERKVFGGNALAVYKWVKR